MPGNASAMILEALILCALAPAADPTQTGTGAVALHWHERAPEAKTGASLADLKVETWRDRLRPRA